jgi:hypothetical protein
LTLPVLVRRAAELDLIAIEDWYDSQRQGLGAEFRESVDRVIARIADRPLVYVVVVLACVHGRRDPRSVRARLRGGA